jgi:tRNA nucleotidyltransferase (CCA-adding enzyme)
MSGPTMTDDRPVRSVMSADPVFVWPDTPLGDVDELLERYGISGVPVVDTMDFPMGVVSRLDVLRMSEGGRSTGDDWRHLDARLAMTSPPVVIDAQASVHEAARLMVERRIHRLVVIEGRSGTVVGVVTTSDLVAALAADGRVDPGADRPAG